LTGKTDLIWYFGSLGMDEVVVESSCSQCHNQEQEDGGQHDVAQLGSDDEVMCRLSLLWWSINCQLSLGGSSENSVCM
jgi:hypothetical protein